MVYKIVAVLTDTASNKTVQILCRRVEIVDMLQI